MTQIEAFDEKSVAPQDIRLTGFAKRSSLDECIAWIDACAKLLPSEEVAVQDAVGRLLADTFLAPADAPPFTLVAEDGFALHSAETVGASGYNPLHFTLVPQGVRLPNANAAMLVCAGTEVPQGADAVAPFSLVSQSEKQVGLNAAVTTGAGLLRKGQEAQTGDRLLKSQRVVRPSDLALIVSFGEQRIAVVRRPRVRVILVGRKNGLDDANAPLLRALLQRDGAVLESCQYGSAKQSEIIACMDCSSADVILLCGRSNCGADDVAALAIQAAGTLPIHGIALQPGGSAGMGQVRGTPVFLLPGTPLACMCIYDLLASRLIRQLGGRPAALPYRVTQARMRGKIVSSVGTTECCRVRLDSGEAISLGSADAGGLASVARANGFVIIPAHREGYASGTSVTVYLYDDC